MAALRTGELTSVGLVSTAIERIERADKKLNAVVVKDFDRARHAAREADRERKRGGDRPLLGLPLTVKEAFDVKGLPTTWGLPGQHQAAAADALLVERLRSAGAIILGKTNVATMLADWQTANDLFGVTNNPWDLQRTPGGSSGGGAAAVAAGLIPLEFGSDLAGSLRIPAAFCGVFAHRPSHGIVPMRGFAPPMVPRTPLVRPIDQSTLGPIARTAADLKLALNVIAGPDLPEAKAYQLALPPARQARLKGFRVLIVEEHPMVSTSADIRKAIATLAGDLARAGCTLGRAPSEIPDMTDQTHTFSALLMSMMGAEVSDDDYGAAASRVQANRGSAQDQNMVMSHRDWVALDRHRLALCAKWRRTFENWDVVVCPASSVTAFRHDHRPFEMRHLDIDGRQVVYEKMPFWAALGTPSGLPVTTVPIGPDRTGLPIGIQIIGPRLEDYTTLSFAQLIESELGCSCAEPSRVGSARPD